MDTRILVAGGTVAGLAVGTVGGYFLAKKRLEKAFVEALTVAVDEEVAAMEQHWKVLAKRGEYSTPEQVLQRRTPQVPEGLDDSVMENPHTTEELDAILKTMKHKPWSEDDTPAEVDPKEKLKYWKGTEDRVMGQPFNTLNVSPRSKDLTAPYQIQDEAYFANEEEYIQTSLVWYSGDEVLAGAEDDIPVEPNFALGRELKLEEFGDEHVLYFRNPKQRTDYEVNLHEASYAEFVAGIDPKVL